MKLRSLIIIFIVFQTLKIKSQGGKIDSLINGLCKIDTFKVDEIYDSFNGVEKINISPRGKEENCKCKYSNDSSSLSICISNYPSGKIKKCVNYLEKEPKGFWVAYYENGKLQGQEDDYGNIHNRVLVYYFEDGRIELISVTKNDEFESKKFYKNGNVKLSRKGNSLSKDAIENSFYENGKLGIQKRYINGKQEGEQICYFEDGSIQYKVNYKNDKKEGTFVEYHRNGKLYVKANYRDGKLIGEKEKYDNDGVLIKNQ